MSRNIDRDFWEAVNRFDDEYKPKTVGISLSSSFMAKARCRYCGERPTHYFGMYKQNYWDDVSHYRSFTPRNWRWVRRMCSSWYKGYEPKEFNSVFDFTFRLDYKNYRVTLHRARGVDISMRDNIIDCVTCECGRTVWAFNQSSTKKRPEVANRKGKYAYPQRFVK